MTPNKCKIIGITGGIATGKSTALNIIKDKGYMVIDADKIARKLMEKNEINYKEIVECFGKEILDKNGEINRKHLGNKVFSNPKLLKSLNEITHPNIFIQIREKIRKNCKNNIIFVDIPLLYEEYDNILKYDIKFDEVWLVSTDINTQIERLMMRNNFTKKEAIDRIEVQLPLKIKEKKADRIIFNMGTINDLKKHIDYLLKGL